jgi:hypothetical protein
MSPSVPQVMAELRLVSKVQNDMQLLEVEVQRLETSLALKDEALQRAEDSLVQQQGYMERLAGQLAESQASAGIAEVSVTCFCDKFLTSSAAYCMPLRVIRSPDYRVVVQCVDTCDCSFK